MLMAAVIISRFDRRSLTTLHTPNHWTLMPNRQHVHTYAGDVTYSALNVPLLLCFSWGRRLLVMGPGSHEESLVGLRHDAAEQMFCSFIDLGGTTCLTLLV